MIEELEAIDSALLGLRVDPRHAELAELALLLADERSRPAPEFACALDARVAHRFGPEPLSPAPDAGSGDTVGGAPPPRRPRRPRARRPRARRSWLHSGSLFGAGFAAAAAVAVGVVVVANNNGTTPLTTHIVNSNAGASATATNSLTTATSPATSAAGSTAGSTAHPRSSGFGGLATGSAPAAAPPAAVKHASPPAVKHAPASREAATPSVAPLTPAPIVAATTTPASQAPSPATNGRRIVQSAQLQLTAPETRIDTVAQELFNVVGQMNGIVKSSSVTAGSGGYATFSLSIPSQNLQQTMTLLSELRYSAVASRTDATQDVNNEYLNDTRALADARALRTALLKQLAKAYTQTEIDSLNAQIHDAEASIKSDEATLNGLNGRISYSALSVQINAGPIITPVPHHATPTKGFTIGRAAHDAVKVLTVIAGVALIALAVLIPLGLVAALAAWVAHQVRRRRREHALDVA
jgi:hypothetical protein